MKQFISACAILLATISTAQAATVLTSIKPIQLIATEIAHGINTPDVLLSSNTSPHDYALRPSDVKRIRSADLIIWFGYDLEPFLSKILDGRAKVLTLSQIPDLALREYVHGNHSHEGHDHGSYDSHFWLGYLPTKQVAQAIALAMADADPQHRSQYLTNLASFNRQLEQQHQAIKQQLAPIKARGYYVFHDAYGYFEQDYGLNHLGYFTISPDRKPGAKTLISIRKALSGNDVYCLFTEPQFTPAVVQSVTRGSDTNIGVLDPIGSDIEVKQGGYFTFKQQLADSFSHCLSSD